MSETSLLDAFFEPFSAAATAALATICFMLSSDYGHAFCKMEKSQFFL